MSQVFATLMPPGTRIAAYSLGADFADAWGAPLTDAALSPTEIFLWPRAQRHLGFPAPWRSAIALWGSSG